MRPDGDSDQTEIRLAAVGDSEESFLPEVLRWPFRVVLYMMLYVAWLVVALLILALYPGMSYLQAVNVLPAGWIPIAAVLFADLYLTQLRGSRRRAAN